MGRSNDELKKMMADLRTEEWRHPELPGRRVGNEYRPLDGKSKKIEPEDDYHYWYAQIGHLLVNNFQLSRRQSAKVLPHLTYDTLRRSMLKYPVLNYQTLDEIAGALRKRLEGKQHG